VVNKTEIVHKYITYADGVNAEERSANGDGGRAGAFLVIHVSPSPRLLASILDNNE